ncbi:MAG: hypothetical protein A2583_12730 [Bdellovibrionales bacterium RIFOXYD1_FULL_53_11]|nr:MAG: hypothetical protein A2583_12730 [Bdellovibrionales bacterium RIFOXYD1_FULL_53_11]
MAPKFARRDLPDGSYIDISLDAIRPDKWRTHGVRYRMAWIEKGVCRVLFDNHHGKKDHCHIDSVETAYKFKGIEQLYDDFLAAIRSLGGLT